LPGSMDENGYGDDVTEVDTHRLNRLKKYIGVAWYQKKITIPENWNNKKITLFLERCLWESKLWLDDRYIGLNDSICTPHYYELTDILTTGEHTLTIRIDNRAKYNIGERSHAWSEDVQTIWNGIVGKIELIAENKACIKSIDVYPDVSHKKALIACNVSCDGTLKLNAVCKQDNSVKAIPAVTEVKAGENVIELNMGETVKLWDDITPYLYELKAEFFAGEEANVKRTVFGMREFSAKGAQFMLNGRIVYLRGTHDAGNFPLTGYTSCDTEDWRKIYKTVKSYGLNHVRFHSFCPPEAAFAAADEEGIILQTELPLFSISAPPVGADRERDLFLEEELKRILKEYSNHPSFCIMCMGNELRGDYNFLGRLVAYGKAKDKRHLYTAAANNAAEPSVGGVPNFGDEVYVSHAGTGGGGLVRRCERIFNEEEPETFSDYRESLADTDIPTISHEVGQWEIYPDFKEIDKYTGVLRARNFEYFRDILKEKGMLNQSEDFLMATGKLSALLYKEEIERSLRTPDYGGFQLLDIHDYPGQGTSTVGILDAFWDSKGLIEPEIFRDFCNTVVPLIRIRKYVWKNSETFYAMCEVANYYKDDISEKGSWRISDSSGNILDFGEFDISCFKQGTVSQIGEIYSPLTYITQASQLTVELFVGSYKNKWDIWVYPDKVTVDCDDIIIAQKWDTEVEAALENGRKVLLVAENVNASEAIRFTPPFWNTQLFAGQIKSMGILCDFSHPAMSAFPTKEYSQWQWWYLTHNARCVNVEGLGENLPLIVQSIDHPIRNLRMGLVFEAQVGKGKLLYSSLRLFDENIVARQLLYSLTEYMKSDNFNPEASVNVECLREALSPMPENNVKRLLKEIKADSSTWDCPVDNVIDGEKSSCWISLNSGYPHSITIELTEDIAIGGFKIIPRQDGNKTGFVKEYRFYISKSDTDYGEPVLAGEFENTTEIKTVLLDWIDDGFNVTRSKTGKFVRFEALSGYGIGGEASLTEIDIII